MLKPLLTAAVLFLTPVAAFAQSPTPDTQAPATPTVEATSTPAPPAPAVPVTTERLTIAGANGEFMEAGAAAGGYRFFTRTSGASMSIFGLRQESNVNIDYRFLGAAQPELAKGRCIIRAEGNSFFGLEWDNKVSRMYTCTPASQPESAPTVEVQLPAFDNAALNVGIFSLSNGPDVNDPKIRSLLVARLRFDGAVYEARPTSFTAPVFLGRRMVDGFAITRDGQPVGRIDFDKNNAERGAITAPVADSDGRQAVLFFAFQLLAMPDMFVDSVRDEMLSR